ncbi:cytochrome P450 [Nocardia iowensis]|uniref:Cytochrome P450 n=1 Tax=Nocardia iowensis TaxID=204891 RepID=A0ABX8RLX2_NOCIO|nr:cytochrome P450 [Nocardia iowensis]QXN88441.1 cytochrome P450 [Nocardia iowensis]
MDVDKSGLPPRIEAHTLTMLNDPYPKYAELRQAGALCRGGPAQWLVTRYVDVAALLSDPRLAHQFPEAYHRFSAGDTPIRSFFQRIILGRDRPDHTHLRRLMGQAISPGLVRRLHADITTLVDDLLLNAQAKGTLDLVADIAFPLPVMVVCRLLGISADDQDEVRPHAIDLGKAFAAVVPEQERLAGGRAVTWLRAYIDELLAQRRRRPGDDLLSRMLTAEDDGRRLTHEDIVDNAVFLFFAGFETTTSLIATGSAALLQHPDQLALLRRQPTHIPHAIEEFLRYDAPVQVTARLTKQPIAIAGRTIKPGRVVVLSIGSANHDERQFHNPEQLDVTRDPNPHLSFGGGIHYCLGASLARIEATVLFTGLIERFPTIEPAGAPVRQLGASFRSFARLPVYLSDRAATS